jgi:hypothetical protein
MRPSYITRIDQTEKGNHGYYVRITHRGHEHAKWFPDSGSRRKAHAQARVYRDELLASLPGKVEVNRRRVIPRSGVTGVQHVVSCGYLYWAAFSDTPDGRRVSARFSIQRYGDADALKMAIAAKAKMDFTPANPETRHLHD